MKTTSVAMVSDEEIAKGVEAVLCQSDPNVVTSLNSVVQELQAKLGLDLSHKADFIRDQITFLLRSQPVPKEQLPPQPQPQPLPQHSNALLQHPFQHPNFDFHQETHRMVNEQEEKNMLDAV